jgi:TonB family protein
MTYLNKRTVKSALIFIVLLFCLTAAMGQKPMAVYYFKNSGFLLPTIKEADYIVTILPPDTSVDKKLLVVKAYYPNGKIMYISNTMTDRLTPLDPKLPGFFTVGLQGGYMSFFPNGHKMHLRNYRDGVATGQELNYYPNGHLYCTRIYGDDKKSTCDKCLDSAGNVLCENGAGTWINFFDDTFSKKYLMGTVVNGLEQGEWHGKFNDTLSNIGFYKDGALKTGAYIDKNNIKTYYQVDSVPQFPGGLNGFANYLGHNIRYPAIDRENNTQGRVILGFICEPDGSLDEIKVLRSVSKTIDEESVRVLQISPKWTPGLVNGQPVRVAYSIPINFTLGYK